MTSRRWRRLVLHFSAAAATGVTGVARYGCLLGTPVSITAPPDREADPSAVGERC